MMMLKLQVYLTSSVVIYAADQKSQLLLSTAIVIHTTETTTSTMAIIRATVTIPCAASSPLRSWTATPQKPTWASRPSRKGFTSDSQKMRFQPPRDRGQGIAQVGIQYPSVSHQTNPYKLADMPIDLERDSSAVELNDFAGPHSAESEHERHLGFDERIPLSLSLPDASGPVENDDGSDSDTTNHFTFRKRKLRSEVSDVRSNVPLSSHPQEGDRVTGGRESERGEKDGGRRKHRRHSDRDRAGKRDDRSLSGVHIEEDGDDAARIRRRMGSTLRRRHARDTSNLTSQWAKRWHRSASSSAPDESQRNSGVVVSLKKTAQSLPQSAPRRQRGPNLFSTTPSEDLTSDEEEGCGHGDLDLADRPSRSDLTTPRTAPKVRETKETARSNLDDPHLTADERQDEFVWLHGPLLGYKVVNGKPHVLVPWYPTWEPSDEYQSEEVERVKQQAVSRTLGKRRGRPPLRVVGGESNESAHAR